MTAKSLIKLLVDSDNLNNEVVVEIVERTDDGFNSFLGVRKIDLHRVRQDFITGDKTIRLTCEGKLSNICERLR